MCTSQYLDLFITIVIALNVITMAMEHYQQPKELDEALKICNYIFTIVFVLESVFKLVAFGFRRFFKDRSEVTLCLRVGVLISDQISRQNCLVYGHEEMLCEYGPRYSGAKKYLVSHQLCKFSH
ncbi:unnamed protein product [Oncorhynchus mykiss]|uniref:Ion transport domain-containing protein n=1 Tax=Oncorhynchus mykiss TaxID=8022 RepID=A0A060X315_ONCMY|nr:unnamed protein product [Oncorhynchus mykiss]